VATIDTENRVLLTAVVVVCIWPRNNSQCLKHMC